MIKNDSLYMLCKNKNRQQKNKNTQIYIKKNLHGKLHINEKKITILKINIKGERIEWFLCRHKHHYPKFYIPLHDPKSY